MIEIFGLPFFKKVYQKFKLLLFLVYLFSKKVSAQITNKKDPYAKISDGKKFIYAPKKEVIFKLIENKKSLLQEYVDKNGDKYGEKILKRYQRYVDLLDEDSEAVKDLEIEITCMLLNMSEVIGSDEWSQNLLEDLKSYDD
jgi:hypothetical protein